MPKESAPGTQPAKVLIAHQSTIPTYRVRFYELLEEARPSSWHFQVVLNKDKATTSSPTRTYKFPVLPTTTFNFAIGRMQARYQAFLNSARKADVLIIDTLVSNLSYLLSALTKPRKQILIYWGHVGDMNTENPGWLSRLKEKAKLKLLRKADHFLVYTDQEKDRALTAGIQPDKITVLNNTLDILTLRNRFESNWPQRDQLRNNLGFAPHSKVLLILGRLLPIRPLDKILEAFAALDESTDWKLLIIGDGPLMPHTRNLQQSNSKSTKISLLGTITNPEELARYYTAADYLIMPGSVGLSLLEGICYDLPVLYFHCGTHGPEAAYLTPDNSTMLPPNLTPNELAKAIEDWTSRPATSRRCPKRFASIKHLTLDHMVQQFTKAVTSVVENRQRQR